MDIDMLWGILAFVIAVIEVEALRDMFCSENLDRNRRSEQSWQDPGKVAPTHALSR